jgi:hypothetical protein
MPSNLYCIYTSTLQRLKSLFHVIQIRLLLLLRNSLTRHSELRSFTHLTQYPARNLPQNRTNLDISILFQLWLIKYLKCIINRLPNNPSLHISPFQQHIPSISSKTAAYPDSTREL